LPLATIFRAFGALQWQPSSAPSALGASQTLCAPSALGASKRKVSRERLTFFVVADEID
jgi:hypothetical protein